MKLSADSAIENIEKRLLSNVGNREYVKEKTDNLYSQFSVPKSIGWDYVTMRNSINALDTPMIFAMMTVVDKSLVARYFTSVAINEYSKFRYRGSVYKCRV